MTGEGADAEEIVAPGTVVGEYLIGERLGIGGFGAVYRGHHPIIGKAAAIKVLRREYSQNREVVERFVAEARSVNQIRHRNIIDIFSFGALPDGRQFFVMELLEGMTLEALIEQKGRLTLDESLQILRPLARALTAAHQHGIAHRDLKPENVFVTFDDDGRVIPKLLDFGIAKLMGDVSGRSKTQSGMAMGSPLYMSPEQVHGTGIDHRADIYSLGAVVFQMLTGVPPFDGDTAMAVMIKQVTEAPRAPSTLVPELARALDGPVLAMLAKAPDDRPQSVQLAIERLEHAARSIGLLSEPTSGRFDTLTRHAPAASVKPMGATPSFISSATVAAPSLGAQVTAAQPRRTPWIVGGVALAGVVAFGVYSIPRLTSDGAQNALASSETAATGKVAIGGEATGAKTAATGAPSTAPSDAPKASADVAASGGAGDTAAPIQLTIVTRPPDAEILKDGAAIGKSGAPIALPRGSAEIVLKVQKPGYRAEELRVVPSADVTREIKLTPPVGGPANTWGEKF